MSKPNRNWGILIVLIVGATAQAQGRREIQFPDIAGYKTLKCDLHMHTVYSDGQVWPTVRVDEAWRLGLDVFAITDHIEYHPHEDDLPNKFNRPHELAAGRAKERNILLPRAAEITRETPPGHFNAIFLSDVAPLDTEDFVEAVKQANLQGAFVFWNHQEWKGPELGRWMDVHTALYESKWLHGMEVCNGGTYYPTAHRWCLEKGLTMVGNSDIHDPDRSAASTPTNHRTLTLVFVTERTLEGLREALFAGRTAVWYEDQLIGKREWLEPLFQGSVLIEKPHLRKEDTVWTWVRNTCDVDVRLERNGNHGPSKITLRAGTTTLLSIRTKEPNEPFELSYTATNFLIEPDKGLPVTLQIPE